MREGVCLYVERRIYLFDLLNKKVENCFEYFVSQPSGCCVGKIVNSIMTLLPYTSIPAFDVRGLRVEQWVYLKNQKVGYKYVELTYA